MNSSIGHLRLILPKREPTNVEKIAAVKEAFEIRYGTCKAERTPEQWKNLVDQYGMSQVCKTENMTSKQVRKILKKNGKSI